LASCGSQGNELQAIDEVRRALVLGMGGRERNHSWRHSGRQRGLGDRNAHGPDRLGVCRAYHCGRGGLAGAGATIGISSGIKNLLQADKQPPPPSPPPRPAPPAKEQPLLPESGKINTLIARSGEIAGTDVAASTSFAGKPRTAALPVKSSLSRRRTTEIFGEHFGMRKELCGTKPAEACGLFCTLRSLAENV
jgi:hypothetical protein